MDINMSKVCTKCKQTKSISNFSKNKNKKDGLQPQCKLCAYLSTKQSKLKNKHHYDEYDKSYSKMWSQKPTSKQKRKIYNQKEEVILKTKKYNKEYNTNNKEKILEQLKERRKNLAP